ncbi:MAG TPA: PAS domain-containing protein, partial [Candidatus Thermoplasmatota archaeon]|nr:PAS domain-containing protein [Candidatus Thermoplasmatota archaeon]
MAAGAAARGAGLVTDPPGAGGTAFDRLLDALSLASIGDLSARVEVGPGEDPESPLTRLAFAVNVLLADLEHRERAREAAHAALQATEARLRAILEQLPVGVYVAEHPSGRILYENPEAARILGHHRLEAASTSDYGAYGAMHADGTPYRGEEHPLARAVSRGETVREEHVIYRRPDGRVIHLLVNAGPVRDAAGPILAGVVTFQDVTPLREAPASARGPAPPCARTRPGAPAR